MSMEQQSNPPIVMVANPFVVESPEKLAPEVIVALFVEPFTHIETVKQRRHTFVWGTRGSGKSMLLRYLEPQCQIIRSGGVKQFFESIQNFVAIYSPCKEGQLNKTDLTLLDRSAAAVVTEHMLNLMITDRLLHCLRKAFPKEFIPGKDAREFVEATAGLFDRGSIASSIEEASVAIKRDEDPLQWLQALVCVENRKVSAFLRKLTLHGKTAVYAGATSGYHDFLLPMMQAVQRIPAFQNAPVYLLLDDADRLTEDQQRIVNTWIANRDHAALCLKISAQRHAYKTFFTRDEGLIEQVHDYSEIDVDELYTRSKSNYAEKVKLITERRLALSDVPTKLAEQFIPPDPEEEALFEQIKKQTADEWAEKETPGLQKDYVYRYATARLFQHLAEKKRRKSYAGFQNMVHLSSGVVRDFLEPCYLMFDQCLSEGAKPNSITHIPPKTQNKILFDYSEEFVLNKFVDIRKGLPPEKWPTVEKLSTLIQSLGKLFYDRLHDPGAREARLFSFTVRGNLPEELKDVLDLGVLHRYFQLRTYSTKEGGGREKWYILNRRVCPAFKLDPTGFEGRISVTPDALILACQDTQKFVAMRLRQSDEQPGPVASESQALLFTLEAEEHSGETQE